MNKILLVLLFGLLATEARCQVHILSSVAAPVKKFSSAGLVVEDGGGYFSVALINTSDKTLFLPSKLPPPEIAVRDDRIDVYFALRLPGGEAYESKSGRHPWVLSRESFFPVELRPGEAMSLQPEEFALEPRAVQGAKPIIIHYTTTGSLAVRLNFSEVKVSNRSIPVKEHNNTPPNRREP